MNELLLHLGIVWMTSVLAMSAVWYIQKRTGNAGFVDVAWAALLGVAALYYGAVADGALLPRLVVALLAAT